MSTKTFQQGTSSYAGARDAHLSQNSHTNNTGSNNFVEAGGYNGGSPSTSQSNPVFYFDLSGQGYSSTDTINSATLSLTIQGNRNGSNTKTFGIAALKRGVFVEGTGAGVDGSSANSTEVCWDYFSYNTVSWTTAGATGASDVYADNSTTTCTMSTDTAGTVKTWDITAIVQNWINGTYSNYGLLMHTTSGDTANGTWDFHSKEATTVSNRPLLTITSTLGGASSILISPQSLLQLLMG